MQGLVANRLRRPEVVAQRRGLVFVPVQAACPEQWDHLVGGGIQLKHYLSGVPTSEGLPGVWSTGLQRWIIRSGRTRC